MTKMETLSQQISSTGPQAFIDAICFMPDGDKSKVLVAAWKDRRGLRPDVKDDAKDLIAKTILEGVNKEVEAKKTGPYFEALKEQFIDDPSQDKVGLGRLWDGVLNSLDSHPQPAGDELIEPWLTLLSSGVDGWLDAVTEEMSEDYRSNPNLWYKLMVDTSRWGQVGFLLTQKIHPSVIDWQAKELEKIRQAALDNSSSDFISTEMKRKSADLTFRTDVGLSRVFEYLDNLFPSLKRDESPALDTVFKTAGLTSKSHQDLRRVLEERTK